MEARKVEEVTMVYTICTNCGKRLDHASIKLEREVKGVCLAKDYLCSIDCLMELGWKIREAQPKLSKSKVLNE